MDYFWHIIIGGVIGGFIGLFIRMCANAIDAEGQKLSKEDLAKLIKRQNRVRQLKREKGESWSAEEQVEYEELVSAYKRLDRPSVQTDNSDNLDETKKEERSILRDEMDFGDTVKVFGGIIGAVLLFAAIIWVLQYSGIISSPR